VNVPNEALATTVLAQISQGSFGYPQTPVFVAQDMFLSPGVAEIYRRLRDADVEDLPF
jgi:hypothetical protein